MEPLPELDARDGVLDARLSLARPVVLRGAARSWAAVARWTPESLRGRHPTLRLPVARLDGGRLVTGRRGIQTRVQELAEFVDGLARGEGYVIAPWREVPDDLRAEVTVPALCEGAPWRRSKLWLSPRGAVSRLHFDMPHNLHAQIFGRKRFLIFAPGDRRALYPMSLISGGPNFSRLDPMRPDPARFPRFADARPFVCTLEPGDAILIPSRFWHHVTSESIGISVNFWWARGALALAVRAAGWLKRLRGHGLD